MAADRGGFRLGPGTRIFVAGHRGLIGSALVRRLARDGHTRVIVRTRDELDLGDPIAVEAFFMDEEPEVVLLAAGKVAGILMNREFPADMLDQNLRIQMAVLGAARRHGAARVVFFGSSCMYPRDCPQPMAEDMLLAGKLEPTSSAYAVAKLAGVEACLAYDRQDKTRRFLPLIPNSVYGPGDDFDPRSAHVLSSLIHKLHRAKVEGADSLTLWGTGTPRRELIHADDLADAVLFLLRREGEPLELPLNIGTGVDHSIRELAEAVARVVGYSGRLAWDTTKPDGAPRKLLDSSRLRRAHWAPSVDLEDGLRMTYQWYLREIEGSAG